MMESKEMHKSTWECVYAFRLSDTHLAYDWNGLYTPADADSDVYKSIVAFQFENA